MEVKDGLAGKQARRALLNSFRHFKGELTMQDKNKSRDAYDAALVNMLYLLDAVNTHTLVRLKNVAKVNTSTDVMPYMDVVFDELSDAVERGVNDPSMPEGVTLSQINKARAMWRRLAEDSEEFRNASELKRAAPFI